MAEGRDNQTVVDPLDPLDPPLSSEALPATRSAPAVTQDAATEAAEPEGSPGTPPPSREDPYIGKTIDGRYVVERVLGEGGMGVVYAARHKVIDKRVAIKVLRSEMSRDAEMLERFLREARAASSIGNPHIVDISDFGQLPDGATYFVMEFLDGRSLGDVMDAAKKGGMRVPIARLVQVARQIATGLAAAHHEGIVHRDLKPDNVMLVKRGRDADFVKILDFGIAKVGDASARLTRAGSVFGTPHYMSPEQAAGTAVDSRTDIYALGVILYEGIAGHVPFNADGFMGILSQHMYKAPTPLLSLTPKPMGVPEGLDAIVLKCLAKKAAARYATMEELIADLDRLELGEAPTAVSERMKAVGADAEPVDYYAESDASAPIVASQSPAPRASRAPLFAAAGAAIALLGVTAYALSGRKPAAPVEVAVAPIAEPSAVASAPLAVEPAALRAAPSAAPSIEAAQTKEVLVTVDPLDAHVDMDGKSLGAPPFKVQVKPGTSVTLVAKRAGYRELTLVLTEKSREKEILKMVPQPARPSAKPAPRAPTPPPQPTAPSELIEHVKK